jgi:hypothetical protein
MEDSTSLGIILGKNDTDFQNCEPNEYCVNRILLSRVVKTLGLILHDFSNLAPDPDLPGIKSSLIPISSIVSISCYLEQFVEHGGRLFPDENDERNDVDDDSDDGKRQNDDRVNVDTANR